MADPVDSIQTFKPEEIRLMSSCLGAIESGTMNITLHQEHKNIKKPASSTGTLSPAWALLLAEADTDLKFPRCK